MLALVKPGDFVMMQFGHNDGGGAANGRGSLRGNGEETQDVTVGGKPETVHTYGWYIRKYIADTKAKGATPIVCSLIPRNNWRDEKVEPRRRKLCDVGQGSHEARGALFIDLNGLSPNHYDEFGQEAVKQVIPAKSTRIPNWHGAVLNAECVIEGLKGLKDCELKNDFRPIRSR